jgi:hypothetical protein
LKTLASSSTLRLSSSGPRQSHLRFQRRQGRFLAADHDAVGLDHFLRQQGKRPFFVDIEHVEEHGSLLSVSLELSNDQARTSRSSFGDGRFVAPSSSSAMIALINAMPPRNAITQAGSLRHKRAERSS